MNNSLKSAAMLSLLAISSCGLPEESSSKASLQLPLNVPVRIIDVGSNRLMHKNEQDTVVVESRLNLSAGNRWTLEDAGNGWVRIKNLADGTCVMPVYGSTTVVTVNCSAGNTKWLASESQGLMKFEAIVIWPVNDEERPRGVCLSVPENPAVGTGFIFKSCPSIPGFNFKLEQLL